MRDEKKAIVSEEGGLRGESRQELTQSHSSGRVSNATSPVGTLTDSIENVRILIGEGFLKDAKKILYHMLREDAHNSSVLQILTDIQKIEIQNVFNHSIVNITDPVENIPQEKCADLSILLHQLDEKYQLGVASTHDPESGQDCVALCRQLETHLVTCDASDMDWIDLGIAFLEMELFPAAEYFFQFVCRRIQFRLVALEGSVCDESTLISPSCLLAWTLILLGRGYDAVSRLQPLLMNVDIRPEDQIELLYLIGRGYETARDLIPARRYYQQVVQLNPNYRDVVFRLKMI
jgi:hypothetical protein